VLPQRRPLMPAVLLPELIAKLPTPRPPLSPAARLNLHDRSLARAESCLARAIYFEARDQPFRGQVGVAQVVMNRVFSSFYPNNVCGVIYQNASHHLACQFTFACDGRSKTIRERGAWARAKRIARETLNGKLYVQAVGAATHYHATYVHPRWVREMHRIVREGAHTFYRPVAWGSGDNLPIWSTAELAANSRK
jgi:spore germination cell wall hydrolase CwlJ-like protein